MKTQANQVSSTFAVILLTTLNATYQHCSLALRYLYANLGELQEQAKVLEFTIEERAEDVVEMLLTHDPKIIGFGIYIWNVEQSLRVIRILKSIRPDVRVVIGGPEVSYEPGYRKFLELVDFVLCKEADLEFQSLCKEILDNKTPTQVKVCNPPELSKLNLPYQYYSDRDLKERFIYVEASRGCPFKCEFCLSSLDEKVRAFPLSHLLDQMRTLIARGATCFKFVDRTFNLKINDSGVILDFFLEHPNTFAHFEMIPDRLPKELRTRLSRFSPGALQLEVGIQTWDREVSHRISRPQDFSKIEENLIFLRDKTSAHMHVDLIVGLPGETLESFAHGFDKLVSLRPHEIQVGILKKLPGTPIDRHDGEWEMVYSKAPPYSILKTKTLSFQEIQKMVAFAKFWDLIANRGHFPKALKLLRDGQESFFWRFLELTEFLRTRHSRLYGIALMKLAESLWLFLLNKAESGEIAASETVVTDAILEDYCRKGKRDIPPFLRSSSAELSHSPTTRRLSRQARHQST